jgi:CMP-N,N'-diacetyllegionaminic acid synthase
MLLAFVPARGGSKGIPRKNLALLEGKPLIQYTLEALGASKHVQHVLLSTDDEEIAEFCARFGVGRTTGGRRTWRAIQRR